MEARFFVPAMIQLAVSITRSGPTLKGVLKQTPFALANAINRSMEDGQSAMRTALPSEFKLRRPTFIQRLVKIENRDRARKDRLVGRMGIQGPRADVLTKFEAGGVKVPVGGHRGLAVPVDARRNKADIIPARQRPKALLANRSSRAFIVQTKTGQRFVLQRYGRKKSSRVRLLYNLTPRARIAASLHFVQTVEPVIRQRMPINFHGFLVSAIRSAK